MTFDDLGLHENTLKALGEAGYERPTPIQEKAIPHVLMGRDVMGIAQTGTGKTAGFTLPMIDILVHGKAKARMPRSLILTPTRELATQIADNFLKYGQYHKLSMALLIGGESMGEQEKVLERGADVLIATPGRLLDHHARGRILFQDCKILVIDEADRMLDMGFIPDVEQIASLLPPLRQTLFFSATMEPAIRKLGEKFLSNPKEVAVAPPASAAKTVTQNLVFTEPRGKRAALRHLLTTQDVKNAFIFCNRKRDVGVLFTSLTKHGFNAVQLHGDMMQSARTEMLEKFKAGEADLLVCSDVAARGIDISNVSHVFNFDLPMHAEDYVHRIGRTGRAGKEGFAFSLATVEDGKFLEAIEKLIGKPIDRMELPDDLSISEPSAEEMEKPKRGRGKSKKADKADKGEKVEKAQTAETTAKQPEESSRSGGKRRGRKRSDHPADTDVQCMNHADNVIGFGDHVPSFMTVEPTASAKAP